MTLEVTTIDALPPNLMFDRNIQNLNAERTTLCKRKTNGKPHLAYWLFLKHIYFHSPGTSCAN